MQIRRDRFRLCFAKFFRTSARNFRTSKCAPPSSFRLEMLGDCLIPCRFCRFLDARKNLLALAFYHVGEGINCFLSAYVAAGRQEGDPTEVDVTVFDWTWWGGGAPSKWARCQCPLLCISSRGVIYRILFSTAFLARQESRTRPREEINSRTLTSTLR